MLDQSCSDILILNGIIAKRSWEETVNLKMRLWRRDRLPGSWTQSRPLTSWLLLTTLLDVLILAIIRILFFSAITSLLKIGPTQTAVAACFTVKFWYTLPKPYYDISIILMLIYAAVSLVKQIVDILTAIYVGAWLPKRDTIILWTGQSR